MKQYLMLINCYDMIYSQNKEEVMKVCWNRPSIQSINNNSLLKQVLVAGRSCGVRFLR